ncbi:uncharacterized protein LOC127247413 [Andrographis paniculata]|uniref:uncharacterized protein LOC127247413 n=1 Tax=Andrographis paniculata TaxID=175694 RepID=UPI0021E99F4C|nr:uncharacterized protein LOC127247413 [Andrographis paniculata]
MSKEVEQFVKYRNGGDQTPYTLFASVVQARSSSRNQKEIERNPYLFSVDVDCRWVTCAAAARVGGRKSRRNASMRKSSTPRLILSVHVDGRMGADVAVGPPEEWNTWEELVLGGAVLRHGTQDWNTVAEELRTRSHRPQSFTPEVRFLSSVCKAKYEYLQKHYSGGSKSWFEELRKRRVEELKRELAISEDSIGSLELKIKSLEADKRASSQDHSHLIKNASPFPVLNSGEAVESSGKETTNDESSAGSFTKGTCNHSKRISAATTEQDKDTIIEKLAEYVGGHGPVTLKKRRGPRKRKGCNPLAKEPSIGESDNVGSSNIASIVDCDPTAKNSSVTNPTEIPEKRHTVMKIFECFAQSQPASIFSHRLDSQKRTRYRKLIMQHVDMSTIRSRIIRQSIKTAAELFRDLLLLANNALVFYSRQTKEYRSALSLRHLVSQEYKKHYYDGGGRSCKEAASPSFPPLNRPVKPRSVRPRPPPRPRPEKLSGPDKVANDKGKNDDEDPEDTVLLSSLLKAKKGVKRRLVKLNSELADNTAVKVKKHSKQK